MMTRLKGVIPTNFSATEYVCPHSVKIYPASFNPVLTSCASVLGETCVKGPATLSMMKSGENGQSKSVCSLRNHIAQK